jgi:serine/threonine protein kinase/tetratricopeptide (TPR) repeat protein
MPPSSAETGSVSGNVGRYVVLGPLGSGGFGHVVRAHDPLLKRDVALKRLSTGGTRESSRGSALREAEALSRLQHPCIAPVHDVLEVDGVTWIVEELVEGVTLRERIGSGVDRATFAVLADDCAAAVEYLARHGIAHCDLKPENVIVTPAGRARLVDFGLARRFEGERGATTKSSSGGGAFEREDSIRGTPAYLAPEVVAGHHPNARSDLFSLGVVYYEMLTATNPFRRTSTQATLRSIRDEEPPDPRRVRRGIPRPFARLVLDLLRKDPLARPPSATIVRRRIERAVSGGARFVPVLAASFVAMGAIAIPSLIPTKPERYLLVEPFEDLSTDGSSRSLARGLTEAIRAEIAGVGDLYVVDASQDPGAGLALHGTLQRVGDSLRVTFRLVDRRKSRTLHGDILEGTASALFQLQTDVARRVCAMLESEYSVKLQESSPSAPSNSGSAYESYLKGRGLLSARQSREEIDEAIRAFENALEMDPDFARARAGLGEALWVRWELTKDPATVNRAEETALEAVRLAPDLAEAHVSLGTVYMGTGRAEAAERAFERALELEPSAVAAYRGLARARAERNDVAGAEAAYRAALNARPDDALVLSSYGSFLARAGRTKEAVLVFERLTNLFPRSASGLASFGAVLQLEGRREEALAAYQKSIAIRPTYAGLSNHGVLLLEDARFEDAASAFRRALDLNDRDYRIWGNLIAALRNLGGHEAELTQACRRAKVLAEEAHRINPNDAAVLAKLAQFESECGDPGRSIRYADEALAETEFDVRVLLDVAAALATAGAPERACETLRLALDRGLDPEVVRRDPSSVSLKKTECYRQWIRGRDAPRARHGGTP